MSPGCEKKMRIAFVIVGLTAIAMGLMTLRREELADRREIQRLQVRLISQRHDLSDMDCRLGELTALDAVRSRAQDMNVSLIPPGQQDNNTRPLGAIARSGRD
jgi:hypothetical protein